MDSVCLVETRYREDYRIFLRFNTGESGEVDLKEIIHKYKAAEPIKNKDRFADFYLDTWPTLAWKCGFDISPESLYFMVTGKSIIEPEPA